MMAPITSSVVSAAMTALRMGQPMETNKPIPEARIDANPPARSPSSAPSIGALLPSSSSAHGAMPAASPPERAPPRPGISALAN